MPNDKLKFDGAFEERPLKDQIAYLHKLCASQNEALDLMQKERNALSVQNVFLTSQVANAEKAYYIQKDIVMNLVTQSNAEGQETNLRIHDLEKRLEALGGDIN